ncbi:hypothetical protein [Clostridium sp. YIM B02506]|uniref:hypothetical protein n=1 Tax=Clostridium sp. YIM B02506 TaxID=2910680 RepID=UPI001EED0E5B|nr:hypothetical protein [Clostridium sp. YIM B02506]
MSFESHALAVNIEHDLRKVLNCDRSEFGGYVDADVIESNLVQAYSIGLAISYANSNQIKRKKIDDFLEKVTQYQDKSIEEIGISVAEQLTDEFEALL